MTTSMNEEKIRAAGWRPASEVAANAAQGNLVCCPFCHGRGFIFVLPDKSVQLIRDLMDEVPGEVWSVLERRRLKQFRQCPQCLGQGWIKRPKV